MGYEPVQWVTGEIITADKLNHTENGLVELYNELTQNYTKSDGTYPEMAVGYANQLLSKMLLSDKIPYIFRTSAGGLEIGDREFPTIVGGSVGWNQQYNASIQRSETIDGVTFTANSDGSFTVNGTATADIRKSLYSPSFGNNSNVGRKIFISGCPSGGSISSYMLVVLYIGESEPDTGNGNIWSIPDTQYSGTFGIRIMSGTVCDNLIFKPQITDLTTLLGSTIADYLYTLEDTIAGEGIAKLKSWGFFTKNYYPYNTGNLKNVEGLVSHDTVGFNQWDEEWEEGRYNVTTGEKISASTAIRCKTHIKVIPNTRYYVKAPINAYFIGFDSSGNCIGILYNDSVQTATKNKTITMPSNCNEVVFYCDNITTYNNDICINLHWDGERDGEYEPYVKHSYPLDSSLTLRGFLKLDASYNLYYDGDIYEADGTVTRNFGERPYESGDESLPDVITDGTTTIYKLETPTTETVDYYISPQTVSNWGTEEFITTMDIPIPVGHETEYIIDLKAKLESAPDNPDSDGYYLMRRYQGENSYVEHVNELPTEPTTDGTYTLKSTVASGESTLSWEPDVP